MDPLLRFYISETEDLLDRIVFTVVDVESVGRTEQVTRLNALPRGATSTAALWSCTCPNKPCWHVARARLYHHNVAEMKQKAKEMAERNKAKSSALAPMFTHDAKRKIKLGE